MNVVELSIAGNSKQETRSGKNLFKLPDSGTKNGITYTKNNDGTFSISGTAQKQTSFIVIMPLSESKFEQGKSYTVSSNVEIGNIRYYVHSYTQDGYWSKTLLDFLNENTKTKVLSTPTTDYIALAIVVVKGSTINYKNVSVQIEEGTVATEYEPYGAMPSPLYPSEVEIVNTQVNIVVSNKNILNFDEFEIYTNKNGVTLEKEGKNSIILNGKWDASYQQVIKSNGERIDITDKLKDGVTYTLSQNIYTQNAYAQIYSRNKETGAQVNRYPTSSKAQTFTVNKALYNYMFQIQNGTLENMTQMDNLKITIQLEEGNTATEIIEHTEQTKVVDIQQEMLEGDYFVKEEDGWKEVHGWNKQVLDGTESGWNISGTDTSGINRFSNNIISNLVKKVLSSSEVGLLICDKFIAISANQSYNKIEGICINSSGTLYIFYNYCSSMTVEEFKNWLSQNNLTLYYKLETPLKLVCTKQQSAQLDDLLNTSTYKNVTHIYSTDKVSPVIKIKYRKDIETMLNNQQSEYETRLSNIEKLLTTTTTSAMLLDNLQSDLEKEVL